MHDRPPRTYGRVKGRTLTAASAARVAALLPRLATPPGRFDPRALKPDATEVWLEIGFGGGEHLAGQAERRPECLILGVEPFVNGVASLVRHVEALALTNVRVCQGDARDLVARLPDASLDRVFILFPDPWPKARHHKRRLMHTSFIAELARVMRPGGRLRFATDWRDYAGWTLERLLKSPAWSWTAARAADWRMAPADHLRTRYEAKALGDTPPVFLEFVRR